MLLKIGEEKWHLHFKRESAASDEERIEKGLPPLLYKLIITCAIHTGLCIKSDTNEKTHCVNGTQGMAFVSKRDQFVRSVGNKLALSRALNKTTLSKETRRAIWDAYWVRVKRPKETSKKFQRRLKLEMELVA